MSKEEQITNLAPLLKAEGFKKKGSTWHRLTSDGVHVVNIQGSQWGPEYYLNVGFYLAALGGDETPTEYRCHVRNRISAPDVEAHTLLIKISQWFTSNGSIAALLERYMEDKLPSATALDAITYLQQHNK
jgi:hypothetical protein